MILLLVNGCSRSVKIIIPSIENSILANRTIWSTTENVYEVPVEAIEKVQGSEIYRFQDSLLSAYYVYDSEVKKSFYYVDKISLENGEVLSSIQIEDMMTPDIQVLEEYVVVKDIQKKTA
ncbi:MAG: hypothetical protein IJP28_06790, partial [Erysipelotrichales bacterium]|nr:hypothetical protein [Erysipelotrichales bacterium]